MNEWLLSAPTDFTMAVRYLPDGIVSSGRTIEPSLRLVREGQVFRARLAGVRRSAGSAHVIYAQSLEHNWVLDGSTVRPLPRDVPELATELTKGRAELSFPDVVRMLALPAPPIPIIADASVFIPARVEAEELDGELKVAGLRASLFPYQARGIRWMRDTLRHTGGLILADEMGLGKTIQIIALLLSDLPETEHPALIVCPTSLIANWRREIMKFAPSLSLMIHRGSLRTGISSGLQRAQVVITTYDTLVNDLAIFQGVEWSWLICDEAQAVKNPDARRRVALAAVPRRRTVPMTGTPVETSLQDLWSLTDLAIPGLLGTRDEFLETYPSDEDSAHRLAEITAPVVLRRRVADVANDLPDRIDIDVPLELGEELSAAYLRVLADTLEKYPKAGALVATGQLQLFCAHPWLQGRPTDADGDEDAALLRQATVPLMTPKLERTTSLLEEAFASGRKVLVFAIFNRCGELIRSAAGHLPEAYWGAINGSTPQEDRQRIVDEFSAHRGPACLVLNPKAAGAGLNITAATVVIHFTQVWNPAIEAQASARAHRRGQTEPVTIYRLYYEDTVERVMIERSAWRRDLGNDAVPISTREDADLRRALSLKPDQDDD